MRHLTQVFSFLRNKKQKRCVAVQTDWGERGGTETRQTNGQIAEKTDGGQDIDLAVNVCA